jgi:hypothetical protein
MIRSYIRSSVGAEMVAIAPHHYGNHKIFRLRERPDDNDQPGMAVASAQVSAELRRTCLMAPSARGGLAVLGPPMLTAWVRWDFATRARWPRERMS